MSTRRRSQSAQADGNVGGSAMGPPTGAAPVDALRAQARITPRNSIAGGALRGEEATPAGEAPTETPYNTLRQLSNMIPKPSTPMRAAPSAPPLSTRISVRRTPAAGDKTPQLNREAAQARRAGTATPYGRAAMRQAEMNRAATLTPGKARRQSGRQQLRETPQDDLRALSRILAPVTQPFIPTPVPDLPKPNEVPLRREADDGDEDPGARPRLSMPLEDDEDDSLLLPTLQSAAILRNDDDLTTRSVEMPRRAAVGRLSRGSFGSIRTSDAFGNITGLRTSDAATMDIDTSLISVRTPGDIDAAGQAGATITTDLAAYMDEPSMESVRTAPPDTEVSPQMQYDDDTERTFQLQLGQRQSSPQETPGQVRSGLQGADFEDNEDEDMEDEDDDEEGLEVDNVAVPGDLTIQSQDATLRLSPIPEAGPLERSAKRKRAKKVLRVSKHGMQYSSLPTGVVKKLTTTILKTNGNSNAKVTKDMVDAIAQASDWFFEQMSGDLGIYAQHAGRKTIDESDVITLMRRYEIWSLVLHLFR